MTMILDGTAGVTFPVVAGSASAVQASSGRVLQVLSTTKTDTFSSTTTGSWLDITGLSVSITPSSTSSKIFIIARITGLGTASQTRMQYRLARDSTAISVGDASGSRLQVSGNELYMADADAFLGSIVVFLDSPASTSSITYKPQVRNGNAVNTIYINRQQNDGNSDSIPRGTSSITVMEIAA
jgi:hypothetical protein